MFTYDKCKIEESHGDVLDMIDEGYSVVHCISCSGVMGAGIARALDTKYNIRKDIISLPENVRNIGNVIEVRRIVNGKVISIFNLVTKMGPRDFPTYANMSLALNRLREMCDDYNDPSLGSRKIAFLVLPRIGCGIDGLEWFNDYGECVLNCIKKAFNGCETVLRVMIL